MFFSLFNTEAITRNDMLYWTPLLALFLVENIRINESKYTYTYSRIWQESSIEESTAAYVYSIRLLANNRLIDLNIENTAGVASFWCFFGALLRSERSIVLNILNFNVA